MHFYTQQNVYIFACIDVNIKIFRMNQMCMPFLFIALYGVYVLIKKVKHVSVEYAMAVAGLCFAITISFISGYTFFNSSSMMMIVILSTLIVNDIKDLEDMEMKIYTLNEGTQIEK